MKKILLAACLVIGITGCANAQPYVYQYGNVWGPPDWYMVPNPLYQSDRYHQGRNWEQYRHEYHQPRCNYVWNYGYHYLRCW